MERGGSSGSKKEQKTTSVLRQLQAAYSINSRANKGSADSEPNSSSNNRIGIAGKEPQTHPPSCPVVREQDQYMPIANVIRIMRRNLPPHAKISDDAKETVQECVSEFISFITGEANDRCQREQRKTVTADDLLWAMGKLGFDNYVEPLNVYLERFREADDRAALRGDPAYLKRSVAEDFTGAAVSAAGSYYLHHTMPRPLPATMPLPIGFHAAENMGMHAASGSSSSSPSQANLPSNTSFDPYAKYK